ncbi:PilW family protein [Arenimonas daejeonensis]|uniref:PilW family protein n=1 Tax=Arenimonas daejeonensis TaxID=370777 RepID=UPI0011BF15FA|nr:PilW family protein [Arenimonas daejeonensis]
MSRDLREAGGNPCASTVITVNQMSSGGNNWWQNYGNGITGYGGADAMPGTATGTGVAERVAGTDAVDVHMARAGDIRVTSHTNPSAVLDVTSTTGLADGDVLVVCNLDYAFIFQATALPSGTSIQHNSGTSLNCAQEFQFEDPCVAGGASGDNGYCFAPGTPPINPNCEESSDTPAYVARVGTFRWYVGNNARGGTSLYRVELANQSDTAIPDTVLSQVEVVEGVEGMEVTYLEAGETNYGAPGTVADWGRVVATRVQLTLTGTEGALTEREIEGVDGDALSRVMTHVVTLRNRENLL